MQSHLKSSRHCERKEAKKRYDETMSRVNEDIHRNAEQSATAWDDFFSPGNLPSVQVNPRERVAPAHPAQVEEHEQPDWLINQFINNTNDATQCGTHKPDQTLEEWVATTFGVDVLLGPDEEDEPVNNVLNAACLFSWLLNCTHLTHT